MQQFQIFPHEEKTTHTTESEYVHASISSVKHPDLLLFLIVVILFDDIDV